MKAREKLLSFLEESGTAYREDLTGKDCTTFKTGGRLGLFAEPRTPTEACGLLSFAEENGVEFFIIGNGSNLLIPDAGSDKLFIKLCGELADHSLEDGALRCGAGASLASAAKYSVSAGYMGLEWAAGIPGTVGGAIAMNASAYGGEIKQVLKSLTVYADGNIASFEADPEAMGYRRSAYAFPKMVVLKAEFKLSPDDGGAKERMDAFSQRRKSSQPLNYPSAGSTFKRPEGYYAGALIDQAGLKGRRVGGACVSEKHAGFIVNYNKASSDDVVKLMGLVKDTVFEKFGVELEPEVIVLD